MAQLLRAVQYHTNALVCINQMSVSGVTRLVEGNPLHARVIKLKEAKSQGWPWIKTWAPGSEASLLSPCLLSPFPPLLVWQTLFTLLQQRHINPLLLPPTLSTKRRKRYKWENRRRFLNFRLTFWESEIYPLVIFAAPHMFKTPREEKKSCLGSNDQCFPLFPHGSGGETGDIQTKWASQHHNTTLRQSRQEQRDVRTYKKLKATNYFVEALPVYVFGQTNVASTTKRGIKRFQHLDRDKLISRGKKGHLSQSSTLHRPPERKSIHPWEIEQKGHYKK